MTRSGLLLALCGMAMCAAAEQVCDPQAYPLSSATAAFADNGDGTVTAQASRLMWMRCAIGQTWRGGRCEGRPQALTWAAAQAAAVAVNQQGRYFFNDWRVPQLRELATIAERQCRNPRVNLAVFPDTPPATFWSATARAGDAGAPRAFALGFGDDGVVLGDPQSARAVRLVRSGP